MIDQILFVLVIVICSGLGGYLIAYGKYYIPGWEDGFENGRAVGRTEMQKMNNMVNCQNHIINPDCCGWIINEKNKTVTHCIFCNYDKGKILRHWMLKSDGPYKIQTLDMTSSQMEVRISGTKIVGYRSYRVTQ